MIKEIPTKDYIKLATLYAEMTKQLNVGTNEAGAIMALGMDMQRPEFTAIGAYENDELIGYITGYPMSVATFYFSGIYMSKLSPLLSELIVTCLAGVKDRGFTHWEADGNNNNIESIFRKFNGKSVHVRYRGAV